MKMRVPHLLFALLIEVAFPAGTNASEIQVLESGSSSDIALSGSMLRIGGEKYSTTGRAVEAKDCVGKHQAYSRDPGKYLRVVIESENGRLLRCTLHPK